MPKNQRSEIVDKYLDAQTGQFTKRTLARQIIKENPGLFDNSQMEKEIDSVRNMIRYRTGALGEQNKESAEDSGALRTKFVREEMKPSEYMKEFLNKGIKQGSDVW
jgi:hypothetical protein